MGLRSPTAADGVCTYAMRSLMHSASATGAPGRQRLRPAPVKSQSWLTDGCVPFIQSFWAAPSAQLQAVQYTTRLRPSSGSSATRMAGSAAARYSTSSASVPTRRPPARRRSGNACSHRRKRGGSAPRGAPAGRVRCAGRVRRKGVDMRAGVRGQSPVHNPSMHDPSRPDSSMHNPSMHDAFMRMRAGQARAPAWACTQHGTIANGLRASCARRSANSVACAAPARRPARSWHGERLAHEVCGPRRCTAGAHAASTDAGSMVPHAQVGSSEHRLPRSCLVHVA